MKIIHAVERHADTLSPVLGRKKHTWDSWDALYQAGAVTACHVWKYKRSSLDIGDRLELPYLKDILESAMDMADDGDVIMWTNDDTILHPSIPEVLVEHFKEHDALSLHRCEFNRTPPPSRAGRELWAKADRDPKHCGRDLFAFKKSWLKLHWNEIPDFLLGASEFDVFLTVLIRHCYGIPSPRSALEHEKFPAELPRGLVGHIAHVACWSSRARYEHAPAQKHNKRLYVEAVKKYLGQPVHEKRENRILSDICVVQLGRYGDIANILPLLRHLDQNYCGKPSLVVASEFASILDGVSYVEPYVMDIAYEELHVAIAEAKKHFKHVFQTQVYGKNYTPVRKCSSYNEESWRMAGFGDLFSAHLPLLFDRRNPAREQQLIDKYIAADKPTILVGVTGGNSSQYAGGKDLLDWVVARYPQCSVVDLTAVKADRIYDLVGVFDRAAALISSDTAYLHIAPASSIPLVALVNPNGWYGTCVTVKECLLVARYNAVVFNEIAAAVDRALAQRMRLSELITSRAGSEQVMDAEAATQIC